MKRKIAVLLMLILCFSLLTGCGKTEEIPETREAEAEKTEAVLHYQNSCFDLTDSSLTSALQNGTVFGDDLYFTALGVLEDRTPDGVTPEWEEQYWVYGPIICRISGRRIKTASFVCIT